MPWLVLDKVLFIHVPRCGGTSITKHHRVGYKARQGLNPWLQIGLMYYYYRYRVLETANFPLFTYENLLALLQITIATFVYFFVVPLPPAPYIMWATASTTFVTSTFIFTAPVMMRNNVMRSLLMFFQSKVLCGFGGETKYMVGTTSTAYMFHITAPRAIHYKYITLEQSRRCGFSIVRNPYSRMVSMFEYNKRLFESFEHFCHAFYRDYHKIYLGKGTCECSEIYCHILPMHEYTHRDGEQIVACVIKQEHLKNLVATGWEGTNVPEDVRKALTGIPHANRRKRRVAWQQYYTQETMDMVYEMYKEDFEIFGYDTAIPGRPDLALERANAPQATADAVRIKISDPAGAAAGASRKASVGNNSDKRPAGLDDASSLLLENGGSADSPTSPVGRAASGEKDGSSSSFSSSSSSAAAVAAAGEQTSEWTAREERAARKAAAVFVLAQ